MGVVVGEAGRLLGTGRQAVGIYVIHCNYVYNNYIAQDYLQHLALGSLQRDHHHLASVRAYLEDTRVITLFLIDEAVLHNCS